MPKRYKRFIHSFLNVYSLHKKYYCIIFLISSAENFKIIQQKIYYFQLFGIKFFTGKTRSSPFKKLIWLPPFVVYFDQQMGASHTVRMPFAGQNNLFGHSNEFFHLFPSQIKKKRKHKKMLVWSLNKLACSTGSLISIY